MTKPVSVQIELETLRYIRATLKFAADDLTVHLDQEYPPKMREQYPTYARRHRNDFEVVTNALYCLDEIAKIDPEGARE